MRLTSNMAFFALAVNGLLRADALDRLRGGSLAARGHAGLAPRA